MQDHFNGQSSGDYKKYLANLLAASINGDPAAAYEFAVLLANGDISTISEVAQPTTENVAVSFMHAIQLGSVPAMRDYGWICCVRPADYQAFQHGVELLERAWSQEDAGAGYILGLLYRNGNGLHNHDFGVEVDLQRAAKYWALASEMGDVESMITWGECLEHGWGVEQDVMRAVTVYEEAIEQEHPIAMNNLADILEAKAFQTGAPEAQKIIERVLPLRKNAALLGHPDASFNLGMMYYEGKHVPKDTEKSVAYFREAAIREHPEAGEAIARIELEIQLLVEKSQVLAAEGSRDSLFKLGVSYYHGIGVLKSDVEALYYFREAVKQQHPDAMCMVGSMFDQGLGGLDQNYKEAAIWYERAARAESTLGQHNLAMMFQHGYGVKQDYKQTFKWFLKSASAGHTDSQVELGNCYKKGRGTMKSAQKAFNWYEKAALSGSDFAQCEVAQCYRDGSGVTKDGEKSLEWYERAAKQGNVIAQYILGTVYVSGSLFGEKSFKPDINKAITWFQAAASQGDEESALALYQLFEALKSLKPPNIQQ